MIPQALSAALGVWLMAAPAVFGYSGAAASNDRITGPIVASFGIMAMSQVLRSLRWLNVVAGAWLVVAAWLLPYPLDGALDAFAVGLGLVALGSIRGRIDERYGGGWSVLLGRGR